MKPLNMIVKFAAVAAILACPALSMGATTYTGTLKTGDFNIQGANRNLWRGKQGLTVRWAVTDHGAGNYSYRYTVTGKNNKKLKHALKRVLVNNTSVSNAAIQNNAIGGLTAFKPKGNKKRITVAFNSSNAPDLGFLRIKGKGVRATANHTFNILPLIDDTLIDGPNPIGNGNGNGNGDGGGDPSIVPVPAAAWAGMAMLGGLGAIRAARRRKRQID
jgi:hypothetical protein